MARFPQIPEPDVASRPDSRVGQAELPDAESVAKPFESGASAVENAGNQLETLQDERDKAAAKVQAVLDDATAIDTLGKHSDQMQRVASQLQQQYLDDPQKTSAAFRDGWVSVGDMAKRDDEGFIYIVDRANTGLHILELSGAARRVANFPATATN